MVEHPDDTALRGWIRHDYTGIGEKVGLFLRKAAVAKRTVAEHSHRTP